MTGRMTANMDEQELRNVDQNKEWGSGEMNESERVHGFLF
jgi:hypothetical protein